CRADKPETAANMASFGTDHIINPFEKFAEYLVLAMDSPGSYRLLAWLTGTPGTTLHPETAPPRGRWIVCGYGRLGRGVMRFLDKEGIKPTLVTLGPEFPRDREYVIGLGTEAETLRQARIEDAVALVAATDNDANNLSIAITARELNPYLFLVVRQNSECNRRLFDAFQADLSMVPPEIIAHECLAVLTTPLLLRFLEIVKQQDDAWADAVIERLQKVVGSEVPDIWTVDLSATAAPGLKPALLAGDRSLHLDCLLRSSSNRAESLACVPLLLVRKDRNLLLPQADSVLLHEDQILFAGTPEARALQHLTLQNVNVSEYVRSDKDIPGGWVWQWLQRAAASDPSPAKDIHSR
ncbi:MAG TPA: NAD-binding protein, partial [Candidatus Competibacteraceae bacterium]|nr:NAD-binding protein [Candidatus Competibacteraceae bacterium]